MGQPNPVTAATRDAAPTARALRLALLQLVLVAAWLGLFLLARLLEYAPHASLWFPPAAVTFSAVLVFGRRALPSIALGCAVATLLADREYQLQLPPLQLLAAAAAFAASHGLAYGVCALLVRRATQRPDAARSLLRPVSMFLIAGCLAAAVAAGTGSVGLAATGMLAWSDLPPLLVPWMIGDYAGLVSFAPLFAVLFRVLARQLRLPSALASRGGLSAGARQPNRRSWLKVAVLLALTLMILTTAARAPEQPPIVFLLFLAIVVQMWIVHTESTAMTIWSVALFSLLVVMATAWLQLGAHALTLQFAMIALATQSWFGVAVPDLYADNARLRGLMTNDPLTGALTRAFFIEQARHGIETARQAHESAALIMIDLDELKVINDIHGHAAGDRALMLLVQQCRSRLRHDQILGRLSGDEFCVFMPGADSPAAMRSVAGMREALERLPPDTLPHPLRASFGIAVLSAADDSYEALLSRADQAMYDAKRRNRGGDTGDERPRFR